MFLINMAPNLTCPLLLEQCIFAHSEDELVKLTKVQNDHVAKPMRLRAMTSAEPAAPAKAPSWTGWSDTSDSQPTLVKDINGVRECECVCACVRACVCACVCECATPAKAPSWTGWSDTSDSQPTRVKDINGVCVCVCVCVCMCVCICVSPLLRRPPGPGGVIPPTVSRHG